MSFILLIGAIYNWLGAIALLFAPPLRGAAVEPSPLHGDHVQAKIFVAGAALTFGSIYFYLYFHPEYAMPFLAFGAFLKYWAFIASFFAWRRAGLPTSSFVQFGVLNLIIAIGFTIYLLAMPGGVAS